MYVCMYVYIYIYTFTHTHICSYPQLAAVARSCGRHLPSLRCPGACGSQPSNDNNNNNDNIKHNNNTNNNKHCRTTRTIITLALTMMILTISTTTYTHTIIFMIFRFPVSWRARGSRPSARGFLARGLAVYTMVL